METKTRLVITLLYMLVSDFHCFYCTVTQTRAGKGDLTPVKHTLLLTVTVDSWVVELCEICKIWNYVSKQVNKLYNIPFNAL